MAMDQRKAFSLVKYSWATGPTSSKAKFTERLDSRLCLVVDRPQTGYHNGPKIRFRIVLGTEDLESINVEELAERSIYLSRSHGTLTEELPIWAIWKDVNIAFQFQPSEGQTRRVQMKFSHKSEVEDIVKLLRDLGVQIKEKPTRPPTSGTDQQSLSTSHAASVADGFFGTKAASVQPTTSSHTSNIGLSNRLSMPVGYYAQQASPVHEEVFPRPQSSLMAPPSRSSASASGFGSDSVFRPIVNTSSTIDYEQQRPATSGPVISPNLANLLPPTRVLPFDRPGSARNLQPLPTPTPVSEIQTASNQEEASPPKQTKKRKGTERTDSSFYRSKIASPKGALRLEPTPHAPYALRSRDRNGSPSSETARVVTPLPPQAATPARSEYTLTTDVARGSGQHSAHLSNVPRTVDVNYDLLNQRGGFLNDPLTAPTADSRAQLANYAVLPPAERLAILDNYFCERMEDEAFVGLCEDVEACWRRIGLGLN
ncbi:hypothetical protein MBLNU457_4496t1 [Dothideomycetes sp. NU457]